MKSHVLPINAYAAISTADEPKLSAETIPVFSKWLGTWRISLQRRALSEPELSARYDKSSKTWDRSIERLGFPAAYRLLLGRAVGNNGPSHVLDCGVGTGALSRALTDVLDSPFALTAVDVSDQMLTRAETALNGTNAETTTCQANATELPFADESFDMAMTAHMLEHLPEPEAALFEMVRVLKPGGRFFACITRRSLASVMIHLKWRTHRMTADQVAELLEAAGLVGVENLAIDHAPWCRGLSLAYIGRKPL
tara:strand:- start:1753 stop:2511 length:759 start_codon:yes stop_codon:yes gene_type:complete